MTDDTVRIIPLGGLGEVGMNCLLLETASDLIAIDCGVTFPNEDIGIDVLHPRFDYLVERRSKLRGVVLTHGHEDHIGALPYLLDLVEVPVYGPRHALELAKMRLREHQFELEELKLVEIQPRQPFAIGGLSVEMIRVTHSITEAVGLCIRTPAGTIVHTGDFKLDPSPTDGEVTDEARFSELGDEGVRLLLSDSTNIDSARTSLSESAVGVALEKCLAEAPERVVLAMFASNIQRLSRLGTIAQRTGRKLCLLGRSVVQHARIASEVGKLGWSLDLLVPPEVAAGMPRREVCIVATGSQGEPQAALARLASGSHPKLRVDPGDTLVMSSRIIPGNDRRVIDLIGSFLRQGIKVVGRASVPDIHASGHAHRDELARMIELVRPKAFIPVHGTRYHLERHAELAREMRIPEVLVIENGEVGAMSTESQLSKVERVESGRVATFRMGPLADEVIRERQQLARIGAVAVTVVIGRDGYALARPAVTAFGVVGPLDADVLRIAEKAAERAINDEENRDEHSRIEAVKLSVRREIEAETGQRPLVRVRVDRVSGNR